MLVGRGDDPSAVGAEHTLPDDRSQDIEPPRTATGWRLDATRPDLARRPRQGAVGDCWVIAPLLALHAVSPAAIAASLREGSDGCWTVRLHPGGAPVDVRVDRRMPIDGSGRWVGAHETSGRPGWTGIIEKAAAQQVAGSYRFLARGLGRFGLVLLTGQSARTHLLLPSAERLDAWLRSGHVVLASTHPLSPLVRTAHGPLPPDHVFAVVGADPVTGHVRLRNPWRPDDVLTIDRRAFRRGFLSVDRSLYPVSSQASPWQDAEHPRVPPRKAHIMSSAIDDILTQLPLEQLGAQLGVDAQQIEQAARAIIPSLVGGLEQNAQGGQEQEIAKALADHQNSPLAGSGEVPLDQIDTADGEKIAQHILGEDPARSIQTLGAGVDGQALVRKLIPILAPIVMAYIASRLGQQQSQTGGSGSILEDILSGALGGGQAPTTQSSSPAGEPMPGQVPTTQQQAPAQQQGGGGLLGSILGQILGGQQR